METASRSIWTGSRRMRVAAVSTAAASALGLGLAFGGNAIGAAPPAEHPAAEIYKPSPMPDRVILTPTATPATSQKVTWRAVADSEYTQAQIALAPKRITDTPTDTVLSTVAATSSGAVQTSLGYASSYHTAEFTELQPGTRYSYRVGDGTNWSEWADFTTAEAQLEPFSFIYYGDAQNNLDTSVPRVFHQAFSDRPEAQLFLHAGDLVNTSTNEEEWGQWHRAGSFPNAMINTLATPGNHEYSGGNLSPFWRPQFPFPDNGPQGEGLDGLKQTVYYVDYQGVRFVSLNTNLQNNTAAMAAQTAWLDGVLADNPNKWTVVTFHHPVYAMTGTRNNPNVRNQWGPLFEKYGVDLVLQGHDHSYGRGNVATARQSATQHNGTVYVVSVSGGKMYQLNGGANWTGNGAEIRSQNENTQLYQLIDVDDDQIRYEARFVTGEHHDGFVIEKDDAGERVVTDMAKADGRPVGAAELDSDAVGLHGKLTVSGTGFDPEERIEVVLSGESADARTVVGTTRSDDAGRVTYTFEIDPLSAPGRYLVSLDGETQRLVSGAVTIKVTFDDVDILVGELASEDRITAATATALRDRLTYAARFATQGSETRALGYLEQFVARAQNQVRDAQARSALVTAARVLIAEQQQLEESEGGEQ
jgi:hypothetical protein